MSAAAQEPGDRWHPGGMDGADGLFYIDGKDRLTTMLVTPYEAEEVLQALLSRHPDLLAGGQMDPHQPRRWLLVEREHGVPDRDGASSDRWKLGPSVCRSGRRTDLDRGEALHRYPHPP